MPSCASVNNSNPRKARCDVIRYSDIIREMEKRGNYCDADDLRKSLDEGNYSDHDIVRNRRDAYDGCDYGSVQSNAMRAYEKLKERED